MGSSGIIGQRIGRRMAATALTNQPITWAGTRSGSARCMVCVTLQSGAGYVKYANRADTGVTAGAGNCDDTLTVGVGFYYPADYDIEPVFTGTVSAVEILGAYS